MKATIYTVSIPAMSTIGTGDGIGEDGRVVRIAGDHRPMRELAEAIRADGPQVAEIEPWQAVGSWDMSALRTPSVSEVYHTPGRDMSAAHCLLCGCEHSGDASEPNPRHPEGCQQDDCPCHSGEEE